MDRVTRSDIMPFILLVWDPFIRDLHGPRSLNHYNEIGLVYDEMFDQYSKQLSKQDPEIN